MGNGCDECNPSGTYSYIDITFIDHMSRKQYLQISGDHPVDRVGIGVQGDGYHRFTTCEDSSHII